MTARTELPLQLSPMSKRVAKNVGLVAVSLVAIGVSVARLSQPLSGTGSIDPNMNMYFVKLGTETSTSPVGVTMTWAAFQSRIGDREPIIIDGSDRISRAGVCPAGHFYPLDGHGGQPEVCTAEGCSIPVNQYDLHGNPRGRPIQQPDP